MLKFLLCSCILIPVAALPFWPSEAASSDRTLHDMAPPALSALGECENADVKIYFRGLSVTSGTAKYVLESIEAASNCEDVDYEVVPLVADGSDAEDRDNARRQALEIKDLLAVIGRNADVKPTKIYPDDEITSGHAVSLKIITRQ